jgi:SAM-dependent methyltransferase
MSTIKINQIEWIKTGDDDPIPLYSKFLVGNVYRKRLAMILAPLSRYVVDHGKFNRVCEVGYGSGVLLPPLASLTHELHGTDIHNKNREIEVQMSRLGIECHLRRDGIQSMNYSDRFFDCIIGVSILEHIPPTALQSAIREIKRVLCFGGVVVFGFPIRNSITNLFYTSAGFDWRTFHPSSHRDILSALDAEFYRVHQSRFPPVLPLDLSLYTVYVGQRI